MTFIKEARSQSQAFLSAGILPSKAPKLSRTFEKTLPLLISVQRAQGQEEVSRLTDRPTGMAENQPVPRSATPVRKKKHAKKAVSLAKDKDEAKASQEQEEEPEQVTWSFSLALKMAKDKR